MILTAKDIQIGRIQQVIRETVPGAVCKLGLDRLTVICSSAGTDVRFDPTGPSYADLVRHAQRLKDRVAEARPAALRRVEHDAG